MNQSGDVTQEFLGDFHVGDMSLKKSGVESRRDHIDTHGHVRIDAGD